MQDVYERMSFLAISGLQREGRQVISADEKWRRPQMCQVLVRQEPSLRGSEEESTESVRFSFNHLKDVFESEAKSMMVDIWG